MGANETLVYIYLITNKETKPSGVYKFFIPDCTSRTGLNKKQVESALKNLHESSLVFVFDPWVFVTRFLHETFNLDNKSLSPKIKTSMEMQFKNDKIPIEVIACFHSSYDTLSIPYPYPIDTILDFRLEILDFRLEKKEEPPFIPPGGINKVSPKNEKCKELASLWNKYAVDAAPVKDIDNMPASRIKKIKSRLKEKPDLQYWDRLFAKRQKLPFYCGDSHGGWIPNFNWFMENDSNHVKVFEAVIPPKNGRKKEDAIDRGLRELAEKGEL